MPQFPTDWMEDLRARTDIVQVVSGYVALKQRGKKFWGLCPFHGEKTASFSVDPEMQMFYCFGCKAGGDVFRFVEDMEHLTFPEAVEMLAERARLPLPQMVDNRDYARTNNLKERLYNANREAAVFFHETLFTPAGEKSLAYLKKRGVSDQMIRRFGLGAAPEDWDALTKHLTSKGYTVSELRQAGLVVVKPAQPATETEPAKSERVFDMFRGRVIFPIIDQHDKVLGFGGRVLGKGEPKYLNTSDTLIFNKRKGVYAANLLRKERNLDRVILTEGYMDVVSLTQFGVRGVVATLGTALTNEQARLMKRYAPRVDLSYDGDSAGQHAILRGLDIMDVEGIPCKVLDFPDGLDPDEFIRRDGAEGFANLPELTPTEYRIRRIRDESDLSTAEGRVAYGKKVIAILSRLEPMDRQPYLQRLRLETGFDDDVLQDQLKTETEKLQAKEKKEAQLAQKRAGTRKTDVADVMLASPETAAPERKSTPALLSNEDVQIARAQQTLLRLTATGKLPEDIIREEDFEGSGWKLIYQRLRQGETPAALMSQAADQADASALAGIFSSQEDLGDTDQMIRMAQECVRSIRLAKLQKEQEDLQARLAKAVPEDTAALMTRYQQIKAEMKQLKAN